MNQKMIVSTRDTFGIAMKASYGEVDDKQFFIYKDPKTDSGLKKSRKGCCQVIKTEDGLKCIDGLYNFVREDETELKTVFKNGVMVKEEKFEGIRQKLNEGEF